MSAPKTAASAVAAQSVNAAAAAAQQNANAAANSKAAANGTLSELDLAALELDSDTVTSLRLDGLALTKIVKHSRDAHPHTAAGILLGLEIGSALEVSNVFALPRNVLGGGSSTNEEGEDIERGAKAAARYTQQMVQLLGFVNADANPVGLYKSCFLGTFLSSAVVDSLGAVATLMDREGVKDQSRGVILIHDLAQSAQGNTVVKAYRLSPAFVDAYRKTKFTAQNLIERKLTFSNILIEIPVSLHNTALLDAFLATLSTPQARATSLLPPSTSELLSNPPSAPISSPHALLTLAHTPVLSSSLETSLEALDEYSNESGVVGYQSRQLARERGRAEAYLARKKAENAQREAQGMPPLPIEDINKLFKLPQEPSRLDSTMLLGQLDDATKKLGEISALAAVQLYAARTGAN
jgi:translation initiation factor 3 subunit H